MEECEKFKSLLEYFVAHLEYCVTDQKDGEGYTKYIKDIKKFIPSGQGHKGQNIQNQISDWKSYKNGNICININATGYKSRGCYLNWKDTAINVNAVWNKDNNTIVGLKIVKDSYPISNAKDVLSYNIEDLGLLDDKSANENLKTFFDKYNELIIKWNEEQEFKQKMEKIKPYIDLLTTNKNIILTGAPGTGKTFLAKEIAKQMIGIQSDEDLEKSDQFTFVQFHPSYDYTDFVEGLRPLKKDSGELGFELRDGVFKKFCKDAQKNLIDSGKSEEELKKEELAFNNIINFLNKCIDDEIELVLTTGNKFTITEFDDTHIIVKSPKNAITSVLSLPFNELFKLLLDEHTLTKVKGVREFFNRSHNRQNDSYIFTLYNSQYLNKNFKSNTKITRVEKKNFVFIIDEINRSEISKVFGELFFSIDPSYRGKKGAVKTQYSNLHDDNKEVFYVPENVYIIGSMNDIDRSVESFDFAMRRRFTWIEITAEQSAENMKLPEETKNKMAKLNEQISRTEGLDPSYHIGAAYFLDSNGNVRQDYNIIWNLRIEPLLKEYLRGMPDSSDKIELLKKAFTA
jgi:5-methylcytosine-specific restriction protein B